MLPISVLLYFIDSVQNEIRQQEVGWGWAEGLYLNGVLYRSREKKFCFDILIVNFGILNIGEMILILTGVYRIFIKLFLKIRFLTFSYES